MPDDPTTRTGTEILNLGQDFPPVATAAWEAAIREGPEGRGLREEAGVALGRRRCCAPLLPPRERSPASKSRLGRSRGSFPSCAATGEGVGDRSGRQAPAADAIRADLVLEAGADAVQQVGIALAAGVETPGTVLRGPAG